MNAIKTAARTVRICTASIFVPFGLLSALASRGQTTDWVLHPPPLFPTNEWGAVTSDCQIGLRLPKFQYELGEPIIAFLYLRNIGDKELRCVFTDPSVDYEVVVKKGDGQRATYTESWEKAKDQLQPFGSHHEELSPHQQQTYAKWVKVNERYRLDQPGTYTIVVKQHLDLAERDSSSPDKWKPAGRFDAISNPVTITVVAPSPTKPEK